MLLESSTNSIINGYFCYGKITVIQHISTCDETDRHTWSHVYFKWQLELVLQLMATHLTS